MKVLKKLVLVGFLVPAVGCGDDEDTMAPMIGSIAVTTVTSGDDIDPDGYSVAVDGGAGTAVGANASVTLNGLGTGARSVGLDEIDSNCSAAANPISATVSAGSVTDVMFDVSCSPNVGSVRVSTSTTGTSLDTDGYIFVLLADSTEIFANDTIVVDSVPAGDQLVELIDVEANCAVDPVGSDSVTVTIPFADTVDAAFAVVCG